MKLWDKRVGLVALALLVLVACSRENENNQNLAGVVIGEYDGNIRTQGGDVRGSFFSRVDRVSGNTARVNRLTGYEGLRFEVAGQSSEMEIRIKRQTLDNGKTIVGREANNIPSNGDWLNGRLRLVFSETGSGTILIAEGRRQR